MTEQQTHAVTTPNKRPLTPIEEVKVTIMSGDYLKQVTNYYAGNKEDAMRFMTAAIEYVRRVPKLLEVDKTSLMIAMVQSAQFRFMPSGVMGEAYIIPYKKEAKFQIGYQGIISLLWRTGQIKSIKALIVYDNEKFEYSEGLETTLIHVPTKFGEKKGEPIGVYAVAHTTNGGRMFKVMSKEDVMGIKAMSKAKDEPFSPWNGNDPEKWMWKKTCLIQLSKFLPKSQELQQAIEKDYEGEGSNRGNLDAGGAAVPRAFHDPALLSGESFSPPRPGGEVLSPPAEAPKNEKKSADPSPAEQERILAAERNGE